MKKDIIIGLLLISALILGVFVFKSCTKTKTSAKVVAHLEKIRNDTTAHYTDAQGNEHAEKEQAQGNSGEVNKAYGDIISDLKKQLKIKQSQIDAFTSFDITQKGSNTTTVTSDTVRKHDTVFITTTIHDTLTKAQNDSLSVLQYNKNQGWFKSVPYIDVVDYDKGSYVSRIQGFKVVNGTTSWVQAGPAGALIYTSSKQFIPAVGVAVVVKVLKIPVSLSLLKQF